MSQMVEHMTPEAFRERLAAVMEENALTIKDVAIACDLSIDTVKGWTNGGAPHELARDVALEWIETYIQDRDAH